MKRIELLSPVGNMDMLYMAIHNGADAVYLAGKLYGARKFAKNFTNDELVEVIRYAHLYGVKVYVTVNIMIYENELDDALDYIFFLHKNNVDALIMQDIGLINLVRKKFPNLEIHASTQCHNYHSDGLKLWKRIGIKRVVLDREMSLDDIRSLDVDIEKEVFIYGALCVSYSGCCLFSSLNGGRSGNRGECTGCCRMPYQLLSHDKKVITDGQYLLSTKELNVLNELDQLIEAGVDSFKIEGRMKSPSYVGYVTRCARNIIDSYYDGNVRELSDKEIICLKKLYNRGFTKGYLFHSHDIMNPVSPNHQGIEIGRVLDVKGKRIKIKICFDSLCQNDGIRFQQASLGMMVNRLYDEKGKLVREVKNGSIGYIDVKFNVKKDDIILKTVDYQLEKELQAYQEKKIPVTMNVKARCNEVLEISISDGIHNVVKYGDIVKRAENISFAESDFRKHLGKLGNTPFILDNLNICQDNSIFVRIGDLNQVRRELVDELIRVRKEIVPHEVIINKVEDSGLFLHNGRNKQLHVLARTSEQVEECLLHNVTSIYVTTDELYQKYKDRGNVYKRISRVSASNNVGDDDKLLVGDLGNISSYGSHHQVVGDYYLNVANHASLDFLIGLGVERVTLSVELSYYQIRGFMEKVQNSQNVEIIIYGTLELMVMKHKIMDDTCFLVDKRDHRYPVVVDNCVSHVMHYEAMDQIDNIKKYQELGIENFRIELFNETKEEVKSILSRI